MYQIKFHVSVKYKYNMEILILGGGVTGISTAYKLLKDGHKVTVID